MTITRRSLFAMLIAAPFATLMPKTRGIVSSNGAGESKILKPYDGHSVVVRYVGGVRPQRIFRSSSEGHSFVGSGEMPAELREIAAQNSRNANEILSSRRAESSWT